MNQPALPAYLQNRGTRRLVDDATAGLGTSLPAHISTEGGVFTLIDAAGNPRRLTFKAQDGREYQQPFLDACVVDLNAGISKRYYGGKKYVKDSGDAPVCWSANGDVPSRESQQQQARTCAECPHKVRGSAISEISGAAVKACRDEKWLALAIPQAGVDTIFRFVLTPGSFKNWKQYAEQFRNTPTDIWHVITRFEWVGPDAPNVIKFHATNYIDEHTANLATQALAAKATDAIVGRDQAVAQIAAPPVQQALPPAAPAPLAPPPVAPAATPSTPPMTQNTASATTVSNEAPATEPAPGRRRGRPAAAQAIPAPVQQDLPLAAPFPVGNPPPNGAPTQQAAQTPTFGIQKGVEPDPALQATLAQFFPRQ